MDRPSPGAVAVVEGEETEAAPQFRVEAGAFNTSNGEGARAMPAWPRMD